MDILVDVNDKKSDPVGAILLLMTGHALIGTRPCAARSSPIGWRQKLHPQTAERLETAIKRRACELSEQADPHSYRSAWIGLARATRAA